MIAGLRAPPSADRFKRRAVGRKIRRDPGRFGGAQRGAESRARGNAAASEVRRLERKIRRRPALRQARKRVPGAVGRARCRARPGDEHAIGERLRPEMIKQRARGLLTGLPARRATNVPAPRAARIRRWKGEAAAPAAPHPPRPTRRARRAGGPASGLTPSAASTFTMFSKLAMNAHAAEHRCRAARSRPSPRASASRARRRDSFSNSMRTRSRDSVSRPARATMQACRPAGSGGPLPKCAWKRKNRRMRR